MRPDFNKVVTESPRAGGDVGQKDPKGYQKNIQKSDPDDLPNHTSMRRKWKGDPKQFTDHIQPLIRFMEKQVGKNWDKVQSEICKSFPKSGTMNLHIWDHIGDMITLPEKVKLIEGRPHYQSRWQGIRPLPVGDLWVHPVTHVIQRAKKYKKSVVKVKVTYVQDDVFPNIQYHLIDNDWYKITLAKYSSKEERPFGSLVEGNRSSMYTTYPANSYEEQELLKLFGRPGVYGLYKQKMYPDKVKELGLYKKLAELNK